MWDLYYTDDSTDRVWQYNNGKKDNLWKSKNLVSFNVFASLLMDGSFKDYFEIPSSG